MKLSAVIILFMAASILMCGCKRENADYLRGKECLQREDHDGAIIAFEASIRKAERIRDSHLQLASLYERLGDHDLLALWHYEQAKKHTNAKAEEAKDIQVAIERNADAVMKRLEMWKSKEEQETLTLKIRLLEEQATRLKKWIEELRHENTEYRKMLRDLN